METYLKVKNSHVRLQRQQVLPQINQFSDYLKLEIVTVVTATFEVAAKNWI
jgi:DNA-binding transcriptional MocR family regulator